MEFGYLVVFRKNKPSVPYPLQPGECTIGSSRNSSICLKFAHPLLLETHAVITVNEDGFAAIINKSGAAPVKVNGRIALRPTILKHEDQFEILEKVFQYFNENLKGELESSKKFIQAKKNILSTMRRSVNPLLKTPAKKSPNLKTKVLSIRKSTSAAKSTSRASNGVAIINTPHTKKDTRVGSNTTSKIIVSKALVSPRSARKRRLSLDNINKVSRSSIVSLNNMSFSKSTKKTAISEEHGYSEVAPSTNIQTIPENEKQDDLMLTKRMTPNKDLSVALIDFNTPDAGAVTSSKKGPGFSVKKTFGQGQTTIKTDKFTEEGFLNGTSPSTMKTPINKRIQSLKTLRHSLKKDTPPPKLALPKLTIQPPTPQNKRYSRRVDEISSEGETNISMTCANAEPSTNNFTPKEKPLRRSIIRKNEENDTPANKSRVSFTIAVPREVLSTDDVLNTSATLMKDSNTNLTPENDNVKRNRNSSKKIIKRSVVNETLSTPNTQQRSRSSISDIKSRRSSRRSLNSTRKLRDSSHDNEEISDIEQSSKIKSLINRKIANKNLSIDSSEDNTDVEDQGLDESKKKHFRKIIESASTEGSDAETGRHNTSSNQKKLIKNDILLNDSLTEELEDSLSKKYSNKSSRYSRSISKTCTEVQGDSLSSEDELAVPLEKSINSSQRGTKFQNAGIAGDSSFTEGNEILIPLDKSLKKTSKNITLNKSHDTSLGNIPPSPRRISKRTTNYNEDVSSEEMDELQINYTVSSFSSRRSSRINARKFTDNETDQSVINPQNVSRINSISNQTTNASVSEYNVIDEAFASKSPEISVRLSKSSCRKIGKLDISTNSSQETDSMGDTSPDNFKSSQSFLKIDTNLENSTKSVKDSGRTSRLSRNLSLGSNKLDQSSNTSLLEDDRKFSRKSISRLTSNGYNEDVSSEEMDELQIDYTASSFSSRRSSRINARKSIDNETDLSVIKPQNVSRINTTPNQTTNASASEYNAIDEALASKSPEISLRLSKSSCRKSGKLNISTNSSQETDKMGDTSPNKFKSSQNNSKIGTILENSTKSVKDSGRTSRLSRNLSLGSNKLDQSSNTSLLEDYRKSSRLSKNASRDIFKLEHLDPKYSFKLSEFYSTELEENTDSSNEVPYIRDSVNKSSRLSRKVSRRSNKIEDLADSSQSEDRSMHVAENINKSSSSSRKSKNLSVTENSSADESIIESSKFSRNTSRRSTKLNNSTNFLQSEDNAAEGSVTKSSELSEIVSRRSIRYDTSASSSQTEDDITDAKSNVTKSTRSSKTAFDRSIPFERSINFSREDVYRSPRLSKNESMKSTNLEATNSLLTNDNFINVEKSVNMTSRKSKDISRKSSNISADVYEPIDQLESSKKTFRRSIRTVNSQSSIDNSETTMDVPQRDTDVTNTEGRSKNSSRLSVFDESTQEAKPKGNALKNKSQPQVSTFNESTKEVLPEIDSGKSVQHIGNLDDTREMLSPVRPLSPRKSIRKIQNQNVEASAGPSIRRSLTNQSVSKNQIFQDSSLTTTSLDQSSSSVISISSQSFSSFKKGSSRKENVQNTTEIIDVVNISSTVETPDVKRSLRISSRSIKDEIMEKSNVSRSLKRQSRTSEMFKDVSCTSTPFHKNKQNLSKKSRESETTVNKANEMERTASSNVSLSSRKSEMISISSDSIFTEPSVNQKSVSKTFNDTRTSRRRSSNRNSVSQHGGEHSCISCRNSSVKLGRSLTTPKEPTNADKNNSFKSSLSSKSLRKSKSLLEQSYEDTSPIKKSSIASSSNGETPLFNRKSLVISLSEKTPEKSVELEDETPKSSIKPSRRSSKTNQSTYNPLIEDITPATPEKLMVSGFTEEVFKTPINTPGLFESIRKSVIRSRKRHRESYGSAVKNSKRARVEFVQEEQQQEEFAEESQQPRQRNPQKSPVNRLSNFEGVKKLMKTPPRSPKNDLRNIPNLRKFVSPKVQASPKNDLTNVVGLKKMFNSPKEVKSPKNDLTNIPNLRRLMSPRRQNTPKNDLTQIPNLRKFISPKEQNSPKNDLSSPRGVRQLLKTPNVQKESANDLTNVTGVASIFNVSGVEVLHQGSDIENSEDLFTKLTGKRPVKAYPRGKSLTPNKSEQKEQAHSRKTMGDIPVCSPRVQQWVNEHANVMYGSTDDSPGIGSDNEDVLFNTSQKPIHKSRIGRSISPQKTGRSSTIKKNVENVRTELLSPTPVQTTQNTILKAEISTPRQQTTPDNKVITPASVTARRGAAAVTPKYQIMLELGQKETTSAEVKKAEIATQDQSQEDSIDTPKQIVPKPLEALKRGRKGKRNMPTKKLDDNMPTTVESLEKPVTKKIKTRIDGKNQENQKSMETVNVPTKTKTRRGKTESESEATIAAPKLRVRKGQKQSEIEPFKKPEPKESARGRTRNNSTGKAVQVNIVEQSDEDTKKPYSSRKLEEPESKTNSEPVVQAEVKKTTTKGRRGKKKEQEVDTNYEDAVVQEPEVKKSFRGRKGKKLEESEDTENTNAEAEKPNVKKSPRTRRGRGKKKEPQEVGTDYEHTVVQEPEVKKSFRGRKGKKLEESEDTENTNAEAEKPSVKKSPRTRKGRGKKEEPQEVDADYENAIAQQPEVKKSARGKNGKKLVEAEDTENKTEDCEEPGVRMSSRNKREQVKKEEHVIRIDHEDASVQQLIVKKSSKGRRGKILEDSENSGNKNEISEEPDMRQSSRSRIGLDKKTVGTNNEDTDALQPEVKKSSRGKRGKKLEEAVATENKNEVSEIPDVGKSLRSRRGHKVEEQKETEKRHEDLVLPESKANKATKIPSDGGEGKKIRTEPESEQKETEDDNEQLRKRNTRKPRNKAIEEVMTMDVDSPRSARARRGINKKYSNDEYEVVNEKKGGSKRKVRFENDSDTAEDTPEVDARQSKRTRTRVKR